MDILKTVLLFLFGEPHNALYTAATCTGVNFILDFFRRYEPPKAKKAVLRDFTERTLAYLAFIIIANRIDSLSIGELLGWDGSTQFLVCLYILAREIKFILGYISEKGIEVPGILDSRLMNIREKSGEEVEPPAPPSEADIDAKIYSIKQQLAAIEKEKQSTDGGENK